jgi:hypothetical protein
MAVQVRRGFEMVERRHYRIPRDKSLATASPKKSANRRHGRKRLGHLNSCSAPIDMSALDGDAGDFEVGAEQKLAATHKCACRKVAAEIGTVHRIECVKEV